MKKTLLSIALAGLNAVSSSASPLELNKSFMEKYTCSVNTNEIGIVSNFAQKEIPIKEGYSILANASTSSNPRTNILRRMVGFEIDDGTTKVYICDDGADGTSDKDFMGVHHKFSNGNNLFFTLGYLGKNDYHVYGGMESETNQIAYFNINTSDLNPLIGLLIKNKIRPLVSFGQQLYNNLVESTIEQKQPELPYEDVKTAFHEVESCLSNSDTTGKLESGLLKLSNKYLDIAKQRSNALKGEGTNDGK